MDDELKELLASRIDDEIDLHAPGGLAKVLERGRRRRAAGRIVMASAVVCAIAVAALVPRLPVLTSDRPSPERPGEVTAEATMTNGCPVSRGTLRGTEWTSRTVRVARGSWRGEAWVFCARTAERTGSRDETLCTSWRSGEGLGSGMDCVFSYDGDRPVALDASYFQAQMGPEDGYIFGTVPRAAASVALEKPDGTSAAGEIHVAPRALGVPFYFFTLFDEPYSEGKLVVRDDSGSVVARRQMEHGLSLLAVDVTGEGKVRGYRTELLRIYEECRRNGDEDCREPGPVWIDCPGECTAGLAGAAITLVATPAEGVTFAGWSGDCSGRERCEVVVDRQTDVTAAFVRSSS